MLTPKQKKLLHEKIQDTFDESSLEQKLYFEMGVNLSSIVNKGGNFSDIVFEVIKHFDMNGSLQKLVAMLHEQRPNEDAFHTLLHLIQTKDETGKSADTSLQEKPTPPKRKRAAVTVLGSAKRPTW